MDWSKVVNVPKYNPIMFELVRNLDGCTKSEWAKRCGFTTKKISDLENGNILATDEDVAAITKTSGHIIETFFMQWYATEIEWKPWVGFPKEVDYYKFKIFRDVNPPPLKIV